MSTALEQRRRSVSTLLAGLPIQGSHPTAVDGSKAARMGRPRAGHARIADCINRQRDTKRGDGNGGGASARRNNDKPNVLPRMTVAEIDDALTRFVL
jgi:hypothetical protein